ncbi:hypothetical protein DSO57_1022676 [Entomophthora muscae]|uniref:Uncharacterized protein n=1 Tax=Entomophthora muscae TaxID=34485 RepID=A0ACC2SSC3_9FUNG|nr:hypothetical protein DSO57_1022676 [Entomophthora muscae]
MIIATSNARSMGNWETRATKLHHYKKQKIDLLIITEVRAHNIPDFPPLDKDPLNHPWSRQANMPSFWGRHVAFLALSKKINIELIESHLDKRIMVVKATDTTSNRSLRVIGVYLSPQHKESAEQWQTLDTIKITDDTVIGGDWNTWTDRYRDTFPVRTRNHAQGATMLSYMAKHGLMFTLDKENDGPGTLTRWGICPVHKTTIGSRLDFILIAGALEGQSSRSIVCTSNISNHMIVKVSICTAKRPKRVWTIAPSTLRDPEWIKELLAKIKALIEKLDSQLLCHPPTRWNELKNLIYSATQEYEKRRKLQWEGQQRKLETELKTLQRVKPVF